MKGRVVPLVGRRPMTTPILRMVCNPIRPVIPAAKRDWKRSVLRFAVWMPQWIRKKKSATKNAEPKKPNSSAMLAKMKSVCPSGR